MMSVDEGMEEFRQRVTCLTITYVPKDVEEEMLARYN